MYYIGCSAVVVCSEGAGGGGGVGVFAVWILGTFLGEDTHFTLEVGEEGGDGFQIHRTAVLWGQVRLDQLW